MSSRGRTVHLILSAPATRAELAAQLAGAGYPVRQFASAAQLLAADRLAVGCILIGLDAAERRSILAIERIRARGIGMPLVALSDNADIRFAVAAMKAGADDILVEWRAVGVVLDAIEEAIARQEATLPPFPGKDQARERIGLLTAREREVLAGLIEGGTNKMIAEKLGISPRTVEVHRAHLMRRLEARNLWDLLVIALAAGLRPLALP